MRSDRSKVQPSKKTAKISSADLAKSNKSGDIELDDKELEEVSGGKKNIANIKWTPGTTTR